MESNVVLAFPNDSVSDDADAAFGRSFLHSQHSLGEFPW